MAVARVDIVRAVGLSERSPCEGLTFLRIRNVPWTLQTNGFSFRQGGGRLLLHSIACHGWFVSSFGNLMVRLSSSRLGCLNSSNRETRRQLNLTNSIKLEQLLLLHYAIPGIQARIPTRKEPTWKSFKGPSRVHPGPHMILFSSCVSSPTRQ